MIIAPQPTDLAVLVVADEPAPGVGLARDLTAAGFSAVPARDAAACLDALDGGTPDLIVLDLAGGLDCLRRIHARLGPATPPVFLLAEETDRQTEVAALVYSDCFVLGKPCTAEELVAAAQRVLELV